MIWLKCITHNNQWDLISLYNPPMVLSTRGVSGMAFILIIFVGRVSSLCGSIQRYTHKHHMQVWCNYTDKNREIIMRKIQKYSHFEKTGGGFSVFFSKFSYDFCVHSFVTVWISGQSWYSKLIVVISVCSLGWHYLACECDLRRIYMAQYCCHTCWIGRLQSISISDQYWAMDIHPPLHPYST